MRLLLVHQNFPGQFRDLAPALCDRGHELKAIGSSQRPSDPRIEVLRYSYSKPERSGIHGLTGEVDEWIRRGELVAEAAMSLKQQGWAPDLVLAHPGWGEAMLLRQVQPGSWCLISPLKKPKNCPRLPAAMGSIWCCWSPPPHPKNGSAESRLPAAASPIS